MLNDADMLGLVYQLKAAKDKSDAAIAATRSAHAAARKAEEESTQAYDAYVELRSRLLKEITGEVPSFLELPSYGYIEPPFSGLLKEHG